MTARPCYVLNPAAEKGMGVHASRPIDVNEIVMKGFIKEELSSNHSHASQIDIERYVLFDGDISSVNHSCEPNVGIKVNDVGGHDFVAMRTIEEGEEITVDYAMRNYSVDHFPGQCRCGSVKCRGVITGWKGLAADRKAAYEGFIAPYLLQLDAMAELNIDCSPLSTTS